MTDDQQVANALGREINAKLRIMLAKDMALALALGIDQGEVALMGVKVAASIANAFILVAVQMRNEGVDPAELYDTSLAGLNALMPPLKAEGLALVAAAEDAKAEVPA